MEAIPKQFLMTIHCEECGWPVAVIVAETTATTETCPRCGERYTFDIERQMVVKLPRKMQDRTVRKHG